MHGLSHRTAGCEFKKYSRLKKDEPPSSLAGVQYAKPSAVRMTRADDHHLALSFSWPFVEEIVSTV
jgi:hypothetical protein